MIYCTIGLSVLPSWMPIREPSYDGYSRATGIPFEVVSDKKSTRISNLGSVEFPETTEKTVLFSVFIIFPNGESAHGNISSSPLPRFVRDSTTICFPADGCTLELNKRLRKI